MDDTGRNTEPPDRPRSSEDSGAIEPVGTTRRASTLITAVGVLTACSWLLTTGLVATHLTSPSTSILHLASLALSMLLTGCCCTLWLDHRQQARCAGLAGHPGLTLRSLEMRIKDADRKAERLNKQVQYLTEMVQSAQERQDADRAELLAAVRVEVHAAMRLTEDERADQLLALMTQVLDRLMPGYATKAQRVNGSTGAGSVARLPLGG